LRDRFRAASKGFNRLSPSGFSTVASLLGRKS
jgi:hypothetical protein